MTLWNIIRDWFVMNIWGGVASNESVYDFNVIGFVQSFTEEGVDEGITTAGIDYIRFVVGKGSEYSYDLSFGDWLSTTSTIIVMILLCIVFGLMVRWLFRLTSGLLQGR